jgi:hypothetical protein
MLETAAKHGFRARYSQPCELSPRHPPLLARPAATLL